MPPANAFYYPIVGTMAYLIVIFVIVIGIMRYHRSKDYAASQLIKQRTTQRANALRYFARDQLATLTPAQKEAVELYVWSNKSYVTWFKIAQELDIVDTPIAYEATK